MGEAISRRIGRRFDAVLVDEMQDCVGSEFALLKRLTAEGVRTLVVADPDQAIYEFRGSKPELFLDFRDATHEDCVVELAKNHRSTSAICRIVSSLRCAGRSPIRPADDSECPPVYVLKGNGPAQRRCFESLLDEHGISREHAMVLAHSAADARRVSGRRAPKLDAANALGVRLARNSFQLRESPGVGVRSEAIRDVEHVLLELLIWPGELTYAPKHARLKHINRDGVWLRETAALFASSLLLEGSPSEFAQQARSLAAASLAGLSCVMRDLSNCLRAPSGDDWRIALTTAQSEQGLPCDTVHHSKGREFAAVLLVITPKPDGASRTVLDSWESSENTEARRVLYVGASRAERLLALGAGPHAGRIAHKLARDDVPYVVV